jgi:hypothetical protein
MFGYRDGFFRTNLIHHHPHLHKPSPESIMYKIRSLIRKPLPCVNVIIRRPDYEPAVHNGDQIMKKHDTRNTPRDAKAGCRHINLRSGIIA